MVRKSKQAEGKQNVGSMNRAQQAYFLDYEEFTHSLQKLGVGINNPSVNYEYSIRVTPLAVFNYATARTKGINSYAGAVFLKVDNEQTGELSTVAIMCETKSDWRSNWSIIPRPVNPPIVRGNVIECGSNTKSLRHTNDTKRIVLDKDSALAYSAVNDATAGQYDQALETAQTIKNDSLKARALEAIAIELAQKGQYDKALEVTETIKDDDIKQMALDAIAPYQK
jgi:type IV pilus assembly protein PilA